VFSASDFCKSCNRTNIGPNHVYGALDELGFKEFKDALEKALAGLLSRLLKWLAFGALSDTPGLECRV
jgi:hypothetical protein